MNNTLHVIKKSSPIKDKYCSGSKKLRTNLYNCYEEEVEEEGEEEKIKEEGKVSFVQAVTALDNLVLFCQH